MSSKIGSFKRRIRAASSPGAFSERSIKIGRADHLIEVSLKGRVNMRFTGTTEESIISQIKNAQL
jgi:hypothetical protein